MFENIKDQHGRALDDILQNRRTVRAFSPEASARVDIETVLRSAQRPRTS